MSYFLSFLEGMITFISPCLLPMIPVYISFFAGGEEMSLKKTVKRVFFFILGFTLVFIFLGALAGTFGTFLKRYETWVNIITGLLVVLFGLSYTGLFSLPFFGGKLTFTQKTAENSFSAFLFGIIFSLGWTPCVGTFLGSALLMASSQGSVLSGILMLLTYSMGLGIPFLLSAIFIKELKGAFSFIKKHYRTVNIICGIFLIFVGLSMMTGLFGRLLSFLGGTI